VQERVTTARASSPLAQSGADHAAKTAPFRPPINGILLAKRVSMFSRVMGLAAVCVCLVASVPSRASACSGPQCTEPVFFPARGSVPANLPAVLFWPAGRWGYDGGATSADDVRFVRLDGSGPIDVAFTLEPSSVDSERAWVNSGGYRIVPHAPLQQGARYALWAEECENPIWTEAPLESDTTPYEESSMLQSRFAVFDVAAPAPLPTSLGAVTLSTVMRETLQIDDGGRDVLTATQSLASSPRRTLRRAHGAARSPSRRSSTVSGIGRRTT
jgi:hypothetical protein